jgi:cellulase/cellobiase CelA1
VAPTAPTAQVSASYRTTDTWDGGYSAEITLTATRLFPTWTVTITLPASADVSTAWEAQVAGSAGTWTFTPQSWSADLAPGASVTFGFQVDGDDGPNHPLSCAVSGHGCAGV